MGIAGWSIGIEKLTLGKNIFGEIFQSQKSDKIPSFSQDTPVYHQEITRKVPGHPRGVLWGKDWEKKSSPRVTSTIFIPNIDLEYRRFQMKKVEFGRFGQSFAHLLWVTYSTHPTTAPPWKVWSANTPMGRREVS